MTELSFISSAEKDSSENPNYNVRDIEGLPYACDPNVTFIPNCILCGTVTKKNKTKCVSCVPPYIPKGYDCQLSGKGFTAVLMVFMIIIIAGAIVVAVVLKKKLDS